MSKGGSIASGAHSGMLAAATTIWKDLQAHGILPALIHHRSHGKANSECHSKEGVFVIAQKSINTVLEMVCTARTVNCFVQ